MRRIPWILLFIAAFFISIGGVSQIVSAQSTALDSTAKPTWSYYEANNSLTDFSLDFNVIVLGVINISETPDLSTAKMASCQGWVNSTAPDVEIKLNPDAQFSKLTVQSSSESSYTTLVVEGGGFWYCSDDSSGNVPYAEVNIPNPPPGEYRIWEGSYSRNKVGITSQLKIAAYATGDSSVSSTAVPKSTINTPVPPTAVPAGLCASPNGTARVTLTIDELWIKDPEEADTTSIFGGDEAMLFYGVATESGNQYDFGPGDVYQQQFEQSNGNAYKDSRFSSFPSITRSFACGQTAYIRIITAEDDSPFGGQAVLGDPKTIAIEIKTGAIPTFAPKTELIFAGTDHDGRYDYRVYYTIDVIPG